MKKLSLAALLLLVFTFVSFATIKVDYSDYSNVLKNHVMDGFVDYKALQKPENLTNLNKFLAYAETVNTSQLTGNERFAFLINIYNAYTIKLILDNYPLDSIRDLPNPWGRKLVKMDGNLYTLDEIEKGIAIKEYKDARAHAVFNCSAESCPPLLSEAFTGDRLDEQLEMATRDFLNNPRLNIFKVKKGVFGSKLEMKLSMIFFWYQKDFVASYGTFKDFLLKFVDNVEYKELIEKDKYKVDYIKYHWTLNEIQ